MQHEVAREEESYLLINLQKGKWNKGTPVNKYPGRREIPAHKVRTLINSILP